MYDLTTHKCFVTRDIIFKEDIFPFKDINAVTTDSYNDSHITNSPLISFHDSPIFSSTSPTFPNSTSVFDDVSSTPSINPAVSPVHMNTTSPAISSTTLNHENPSTSPSTDLSNHSISPIPVPFTSISPDSHDISPSSQIPTNHMSSIRHSSRNIKPPLKLQDYVCPSLPNNSSSLSFSVNTQSAKMEPSTYYQASVYPEWQLAMQKELDALESNDTWELQKLPKGKKAIGSKWVFKVKYNPDGSIERHKARLVATGYQQIAGKTLLIPSHLLLR